MMFVKENRNIGNKELVGNGSNSVTHITAMIKRHRPPLAGFDGITRATTNATITTLKKMVCETDLPFLTTLRYSGAKESMYERAASFFFINI
jgi:hypothetical protein